MSVAAMTLEGQRPVKNNYDKMSKQYEQTLNNPSTVVGGLMSGPASPTPCGSEDPNAASSSNINTLHSRHPAYHHYHVHQSSQQQQQQRIQMTARPITPPLLSNQQLQNASKISTTTTTTTPTVNSPHQRDIIGTTVVADEQRLHKLEDEVGLLKAERNHLHQQCADAQRREKILMRRLANKEQDFQDYVRQIAEYKAAQAPVTGALRSALLDPAVNLLFEKLKKELKATKAKLEETQNELSAWKFTPDSNTGKRLMAKCRLLYQENEELGKMTSNGRLAKLETELAMQKSFSEEVKKSQSELDDFLQELDEDVEGMQSTILFLQQELKTTRERIKSLEEENHQLKAALNSSNVHEEEPGKVVAEESLSLKVDDKVHVHTIVNPNGSTIQSPPITASHDLSNDNDYKSSLSSDAIKEKVCTYPPNKNNTFYNGNEDITTRSPTVTSVEVTTTTSAMPGTEIAQNDFHNINEVNKLRTAASRKRNYDGETYDAVGKSATRTGVVATPRTLPPKKSKLRVTPAARPPIQSIDEREVLTITPMKPLVDTVPNNEVELAIPYELPFGGDSFNPETEDGVAQRIVTRRRSVRLNGANPSGGDSNH